MNKNGRTSKNSQQNGPDNRFRDLLMSMLDGFVAVDMYGNITESNPAYRQMLGYTSEDLSRLTYRDLTPAGWHEFERRIIEEQILPQGHSVVYQKEYIRSDGTVFPVELRTFLMRTPAGEPSGMWAIVRDITERKQADDALRRSEEKYRSIVECSPTGMHIYKLDARDELIFSGANPAANAMLGIDHAPLIGKTISQAFPSLDGTPIPDLYRRVALGEIGPQSFETPYSDERFSGYYTVHVFRTGVRSVTVDFSDITRRRQMEEDLKRSEIEYRDTLNSIPDWIYVVDGNFRVVMVNSALRVELSRQGYRGECIGTPVDSSLPLVCGESIEGIRHVFATGAMTVTRKELRLGSRVIHAEFTLVPIFKDGEVAKVILMIRDRSKEYEIEELKRRSAEQKEVLLREIHHRVKNNLAIVISLLNFHLRANPGEELTRLITDIQLRIRSMALIHEHLYRSESLDRIPLASYAESLASMIMTAFSGHRIRLVPELEPIDVSIETALPIGLIINELLTNAFKYAFPAGMPGEIRLRLARQEGDRCLIAIEDNGVGLPPDITLESETSLGLFIIRLLVQQLDGTVEIIRNNGTTFRIVFRNILRERG